MKYLYSITLLFILSAMVVPFLLPAQVSAIDISYTPLAPIPGTVTNDALCAQSTVSMTAAEKQAYNNACKVTNLGTYLRGLYITGIALAGLLAVFSLVRGGFTLLFTDSILGKTEGKSIILHAVGGLLIVFASFVLVNTINPQLGTDLNLQLDFPQQNVKEYEGQVPLINPITTAAQLTAEATARANPETQRAAEAALRTQAQNAANAGNLALSEALTQQANEYRHLETVVAQSKKELANGMNDLWDSAKSDDFGANGAYSMINSTGIFTEDKKKQLEAATKRLENLQKLQNELIAQTRAGTNTNPDIGKKFGEVDDAITQLSQQINYFKKGCDANGKTPISSRVLGFLNPLSWILSGSSCN